MKLNIKGIMEVKGNVLKYYVDDAEIYITCTPMFIALKNVDRVRGVAAPGIISLQQTVQHEC